MHRPQPFNTSNSTKEAFSVDKDSNGPAESSVDHSNIVPATSEMTSRREFIGMGISTLALSMGERGEVGWDQQSSLPSVLWREGTGIATNPVVFEDLVFGVSGNGTVRANNAQTGINLWREPTGTSSPYPRAIAVFNSTLFVGDRTGRILALTPSTGEKRWERTLSGGVFGFSLYNDSVIVASSDGLRSIALKNGLVN